jgi:hypothetical protein
LDFIKGLPNTRSRYDSIWVLVDHLTKVAHFMPMKTTYKNAKLVNNFMNWIVCLHGVHKGIVSDRGTHVTSLFLPDYMNYWEPSWILVQPFTPY